MKKINLWISLANLLLCASLLTLAGCGSGGSGPAAPVVPAAPAVGGTTPLEPAGVTATFSQAVAINDANQVVGFAETAAGSPFTAAVWTVNSLGETASAPTALDALPGGSFSSGFSVDTAGNVVGVADNGLAQVAVIWPTGSTTPAALPELVAGGFSAAYGINPDGNLIVGEAEDASFTTRAVVWPVVAGTVGAPVVLPEVFALPDLPGAFSAAYAVNDAGWVVGEVEDNGFQFHAVVWQPDVGGGYSTMTDLRTGGEVNSVAQGINSQNQVVGESEVLTGSFVPALWADDGTGEFNRTDLSTDGGAAGINDAGRIAGWNGPIPNAAVWDSSSLLGTDLFSAESQAYSINNNNLVVGYNGNEGFVRLTN
ncbi:MAG TPA: hypothetical protein VJ995_01080 [Geothermobacteraceae bacterium]|nr:hypothetical protein [Geothermobacteraceae bacterium]